jgi:hypothetical protein
MEAQTRRTTLGTLVAVAAALACVTAAGAAGGRDDARGSGKYPDPNAPGTDGSFSFSAANTSSSGLDARGRITLTNPATNSDFRGRVICLKVTGKRAEIGGVVTSSTGQAPGEPVVPGDSFVTFAEDNGKSKSIRDSLVTFTFHDPAPSLDLCNADQSGQTLITSGRITVRDR